MKTFFSFSKHNCTYTLLTITYDVIKHIETYLSKSYTGARLREKVDIIGSSCFEIWRVIKTMIFCCSCQHAYTIGI